VNFDAIDALDETRAKEILKNILSHACVPAFGVLPQRELDLLLFKALRDAGMIDTSNSHYTLMTALKITKAKARNLVFDLEIRDAQMAASLDDRAREALAKPRGFVKDGAYLAFGIENPVVQAHIRDKVNDLGHLTDASFDSAIVKIKPDAMGELVEALMNEDEKAAFSEAMIEAGYEQDESLSTALKEGLKHLGNKTIGETATMIGAGYIDDLADFLMPHARKAKDKVGHLLKQAKAETERATARGAG
jgi:hypothetical protein